MVTAVMPGTFDPMTLGHENLIARALRLFDHLVVAVADGATKTPLVPVAKRIAWISEVYAEQNRITVTSINGLLVDCAHQHNAAAIVRGIRCGSDFDLEMQLSGMNKKLAADIETVFIAPADEHRSITSTLVREVVRLRGDITPFVSPVIANKLRHFMED